MKTETTIKIGQIGFGVVGSYPPARWRYDGVRGNAKGPKGERCASCILTHVPRGTQTPFPPQGVDWDTVVRIMS